VAIDEQWILKNPEVLTVPVTRMFLALWEKGQLTLTELTVQRLRERAQLGPAPVDFQQRAAGERDEE